MHKSGPSIASNIPGNPRKYSTAIGQVPLSRESVILAYSNVDPEQLAQAVEKSNLFPSNMDCRQSIMIRINDFRNCEPAG